MTRARFYAFALNEYRYRRVSFTMHSTQVAAEATAYKQSGQSKRSRSRVGDLSAEGDLQQMVIAGLEGFETWAKESNYEIDWKEKLLIYVEPKDTVPDMAKTKTHKKTIDSYLKPDVTMDKKTIRAPSDLWDRVEKVADKKGDTSMNAIVVAALEKVCDEEGV